MTACTCGGERNQSEARTVHKYRTRTVHKYRAGVRVQPLRPLNRVQPVLLILA